MLARCLRRKLKHLKCAGHIFSYASCQQWFMVVSWKSGKSDCVNIQQELSANISRRFRLWCSYHVTISRSVSSEGAIMFMEYPGQNACIYATSVNMDISIASSLFHDVVLWLCFFQDLVRTAQIAKLKALWTSADRSIGYPTYSKPHQLSFKELEQTYVCCMSLSGTRDLLVAMFSLVWK